MRILEVIDKALRKTPGVRSAVISIPENDPLFQRQIEIHASYVGRSQSSVLASLDAGLTLERPSFSMRLKLG